MKKKPRKEKANYLVRFYETRQMSYGGYWVENLFHDETEAIQYYSAHLESKPEFYICFPLKIKLGIKVKAKSFLRQFKIPASITIKDIDFE